MVAKDIPVEPTVPSYIVQFEWGEIKPSCWARVMMERATRSFEHYEDVQYLPARDVNSDLPRIVQWVAFESEDILKMRVLPIRESSEGGSEVDVAEWDWVDVAECGFL